MKHHKQDLENKVCGVKASDDGLMVKIEVTKRPFVKAMDKLRRKIAEKLLKSVDFGCLETLMKLL